MVRQQNIFTLNHKGLSLIEIVVCILIISIISVISIVSFNSIIEKNKIKLFEEEATKIYYSFVENINVFKNYKVFQNGSSIEICYYPYKAKKPSESGEYIDDFDYINFTNNFLGSVFKDLDEFKNGKIEYTKASYTVRKASDNTIFKYIVEDKGVITLNLLMKDGNYKSYDTLTIISITYTDLSGNTKTFNI